MFRSFQTRLVTIFVGLFFLVQLILFLAVYQATNYNVLEQIKAQLSYASNIFERHLSERADRLADGAIILTTEYAFRQAISERDAATSLSVIRNLGARIKADRVMLISLEGDIIADTRRPGLAPVKFPYTPLIELVEMQDSVKAIIMLNDKLYDFVIVPVLAPLAIAWVGIGIEIDDELTRKFRSLSPLDVDISFLQHENGVGWSVVASTLSPELLVTLVNDSMPILDQNLRVEEPGEESLHVRHRDVPVIKSLAGDDYVVLVAGNLAPEYSPAVIALLQYPLERARKPFQPLLFWLQVLSLLGILLAALGSLLIARSVSRPLHLLLDAANRIGHANYSQKIQLHQKDDFGRLAAAFNMMMDGIAEREEQVIYQANHDVLTGLPKRIQFERLLKNKIDQQQNMHLTVILVKVERLHEINNTLGHQVGDLLILKISERLKLAVEAGGVLAQLTKNTFIMLSVHDELNDRLIAAENIMALFDEPYVVDDINIDVHLRIGMSLYPQHGMDSQMLIQRADIAIYSAIQGGQPFAMYSPEEDTYTRDKLSLMSELKSGLMNNEFQLYYQPKIDMSKKHTTHAEALVRWVHPVRGFIPPDDFIPLAEQTGNIHQLTLWVLDQAIHQCSDWNATGYDMSVAVNISVKDLLVRKMPDIIMAMLEKYQLAAKRLVLEITESSIMEDPEVALTVLTKLQGFGLRISIDDFGTGYSSMEYLKKLPAEILKVDKSFVMDLSTNKDDQILVRSMIELAHNMGMVVVAEGVEDVAALEILMANNCDFVQGYYISRPLPVNEFNEWLETSEWGLKKTK